MANEYTIRTDMKVSGSALTVDGLTTLTSIALPGDGTSPATGGFQSPDVPVVTSGGDDTLYLSEPTQWIPVTIGGTDYVIPAYEI
jgi:hypothetical protein